MSKHYLNEVGTDLLLDTGVNIGTAAFGAILYKKGDGVTQGTWTAELYSSYSKLASATGTYFLKYTLAYGDFDISGDWRFQAHIGATDGTWYGETAKETIYDQLQ